MDEFDIKIMDTERGMLIGNIISKYELSKMLEIPNNIIDDLSKLKEEEVITYLDNHLLNNPNFRIIPFKYKFITRCFIPGSSIEYDEIKLDDVVDPQPGIIASYAFRNRMELIMVLSNKKFDIEELIRSTLMVFQKDLISVELTETILHKLYELIHTFPEPNKISLQ